MSTPLRSPRGLAGLVVVCLIGLGGIVAAQAPAPLDEAATSARPDVRTVMDRAMSRASAQDERGAELWFESMILTTNESLNGDEEVSESETSTYRRYPLEGHVYEELVAVDGEPLDADEQREEDERREEFIRDAREAAERGEDLETNDERQVRFDEELMSRYTAQLSGETTIDDERHWIVDFQPRPGKLPENTRMDKALNQSSGTLYVSQSDYGIRRIEFQLNRPVQYMWGLVASLRTATGRLDFTRVETDIWLPQDFDLRIDIRVFFRTMRRRVLREWVERDRIVQSTDAAHP